MEQILGMIADGGGILLPLVLLAGLLVWNVIKEPLKTAIHAHTTAQQRQVLTQLGREAFAFAETLHAQKDGPAKMNEAVKYLLDRCPGCGITQPEMDAVRAVIESAWLDDRRQSGLPVMSSSQVEQR